MSTKVKNVFLGFAIGFLSVGLLAGVGSFINSDNGLFDHFSNYVDQKENESSEDVVNDYKLTLVGSMNEWNEKDNTYLLSKESENIYSIEYTSIDDNAEFKIINNNSYDVQFSTKNVVKGTELIDTTKENTFDSPKWL